jgi:hypothetical protein
MTTTIPRAIVLLIEALRDRESRPQLISDFQALIWNCSEPAEPDGPLEILRDLALDLDYYVQDPEKRREDASYYGDERFEEEIRLVLGNLKARGLQISFDEIENTSSIRSEEA